MKTNLSSIEINAEAQRRKAAKIGMATGRYPCFLLSPWIKPFARLDETYRISAFYFAPLRLCAFALTLSLQLGIPLAIIFCATHVTAATFSKDIAPIFQKHCQECHRPGEIGPMSLLTYAETRPWAKAIKKSVLDRTMPPWHADAERGMFSNDISLTEEEIKVVAAWVDEGAPEGDPRDLPPPLTWNMSEWKLGEPDIALFPEKPFHVPATGEFQDLYQCLVLPTNLDHDVWVDAFEYKVDNRKVVHHIVGFQDSTGKAMTRDAATPETGFPCDMGGSNSAIGPAEIVNGLLGGWGPGTPPNVNHPGTAKLTKKRLDHYSPNSLYKPNRRGAVRPIRRGVAFGQGSH